MLAQAAEINRFPQIRFVKLHHLHIVKGSILAARYQKEPFTVFTLEEYTDFLCEFLPLLRPDIVIQRLFGVADQDLLIAPHVEPAEIRRANPHRPRDRATGRFPRQRIRPARHLLTGHRAGTTTGGSISVKRAVSRLFPARWI